MPAPYSALSTVHALPIPRSPHTISLCRDTALATLRRSGTAPPPPSPRALASLRLTAPARTFPHYLPACHLYSRHHFTGMHHLCLPMPVLVTVWSYCWRRRGGGELRRTVDCDVVWTVEPCVRLLPTVNITACHRLPASRLNTFSFAYHPPVIAVRWRVLCYTR